MPSTPDPVLMALAALQNDVTVIKDAVTAAPAPSPPSPAPADEAAKFNAKWALVTAAEFKAKYGVDYGQAIPAGELPEPDVAEQSYRARCCYDPRYGRPGVRYGNPTPIVAAINVIAHATQDTATQFYECGLGDALACDPDALAYGFLVGVFATKEEYQKSLGTHPQPSSWKGISLARACSMAWGGSPSGG
jgi:hypothetical protein